MGCFFAENFNRKYWSIMPNLVIVESPAKARTIKRFLGPDYEIEASMGHVRDLPEHSLGIDIENGFLPNYVISKGKEKTVNKLKALAKDADHIYLAPDPDREGEAIAWHLKELLDSKKGNKDFHRVAFHEITKSAVARAFDHPGDINSSLVDAQQARRILDRLVGFKVSPLLKSHIRGGVSAGRVQSVALRMVCEREREIEAFEPQEYWVFEIDFEHMPTPAPDNRFKAKLIKIDGQKAEIHSGEEAQALFDIIQSSPSFSVSSVEVKPQTRNAPPPFITSTLQQRAGISARKTMQIAQKLYEGIDIGTGGPTGLITYMRTDSVAVSTEAQNSARGFISSEYGQEYVPAKQRNYQVADNAQAAHEAIRPTDVTFTPEKARQFLDSEQLRIYTLIWKRFVASQMAPARLEKTTVDVINNQSSKTCTFQASAIVTKFPGHMIVSGKKDEDDENKNAEVLGKIKEDDPCRPEEISKEQKFTEPPPRYTEPSLIRELESNGIGRPSTYATIVGTIQTRKYVDRIDKGKLQPTEIGFNVNDYLVEKLPALFEIGFTAEMEKLLDDIEESNLDWQEMLARFYGNYSTWLDNAKFADAPENEKASGLISMIDRIANWAEPEKRRGRTYDDKKFFNDIKEKFEKEPRITAKQWIALLRLAVKYKEQLPGFDAFVDQFKCEEDVAELKRQASLRAEAAQKRKENLNSEEFIKLKEAFDLFENVQWDEPVKKGARTYDDKKFFNSLKKQAESGKVLSEKQMAAFKRIAAKYAEQVGADKLNELLGLEEMKAEAAAGNPEVEELLAQMANVSNWEEPVKKGKRTFDDKSFFESLQKQYGERKSLSSRQIYALKKMAAKYAGK
jgi:DNA topoisomerase-1